MYCISQLKNIETSVSRYTCLTSPPTIYSIELVFGIFSLDFCFKFNLTEYKLLPNGQLENNIKDRSQSIIIISVLSSLMAWKFSIKHCLFYLFSTLFFCGLNFDSLLVYS